MGNSNSVMVQICSRARALVEERDWPYASTPDFRDSPPSSSRPEPAGSTLATPPIPGVVMSLPRILRPLGAGASTRCDGRRLFPTTRDAIRLPRSSAAARRRSTPRSRAWAAERLLERIERVRFEMMTLWQRMTFDTRPSDLIGTYELHSDLRNYSLVAWRNTRRFVGGPDDAGDDRHRPEGRRAFGAFRRNPMERRRRGRRSASRTSTSERRSSRSRPTACCSPRAAAGDLRAAVRHDDRRTYRTHGVSATIDGFPDDDLPPAERRLPRHGALSCRPA